jgi:hypothetical protein
MYNVSYRSERVSDLHLSEGCFGIRTILLAMTDDQAVSKKVADYYFLLRLRSLLSLERLVGQHALYRLRFLYY